MLKFSCCVQIEGAAKDLKGDIKGRFKDAKGEAKGKDSGKRDRENGRVQMSCVMHVGQFICFVCQASFRYLCLLLIIGILD